MPGDRPGWQRPQDLSGSSLGPWAPPCPELSGPYAQQEGRAPGSISTLLAQRRQTRSLSPHSLPAVSPSQLPAVGLIPLFLYF